MLSLSFASVLILSPLSGLVVLGSPMPQAPGPTTPLTCGQRPVNGVLLASVSVTPTDTSIESYRDACKAACDSYKKPRSTDKCDSFAFDPLATAKKCKLYSSTKRGAKPIPIVPNVLICHPSTAPMPKQYQLLCNQHAKPKGTRSKALTGLSFEQCAQKCNEPPAPRAKPCTGFLYRQNECSLVTQGSSTFNYLAGQGHCPKTFALAAVKCEPWEFYGKELAKLPTASQSDCQCLITLGCDVFSFDASKTCTLYDSKIRARTAPVPLESEQKLCSSSYSGPILKPLPPNPMPNPPPIPPPCGVVPSNYTNLMSYPANSIASCMTLCKWTENCHRIRYATRGSPQCTLLKSQTTPLTTLDPVCDRPKCGQWFFKGRKLSDFNVASKNDCEQRCKETTGCDVHSFVANTKDTKLAWYFGTNETENTNCGLYDSTKRSSEVYFYPDQELCSDTYRGIEPERLTYGNCSQVYLSGKTVGPIKTRVTIKECDDLCKEASFTCTHALYTPITQEDGDCQLFVRNYNVTDVTAEKYYYFAGEVACPNPNPKLPLAT